MTVVYAFRAYRAVRFVGCQHVFVFFYVFYGFKVSVLMMKRGLGGGIIIFRNPKEECYSGFYA